MIARNLRFIESAEHKITDTLGGNTLITNWKGDTIEIKDLDDLVIAIEEFQKTERDNGRLIP